MPLFENWKVIRQRLWLIILLTLIGGSGAFYYTQQKAPEYQSTTTLFLNPAVASALLPYQRSSTLESLSNTYAEFLRTRSFANRVAQKLDKFLTEKQILDNITTEWVRDTQFFRISGTYLDPHTAQQLARVAAEVLIDENISRQQAQQEQLAMQADQARIQNEGRLDELQTALQNELLYYNSEIQTVQAQISDIQKQDQSQDRDQRLANLRSNLRDMQSLRLGVLSSLTEAQATLASKIDVSASNTDTAVVIDAAPLPSLPLSRHIIELTLLGALAALVLGVAIAFLMEYVDYTVKTPEALDIIYGLPTQGVVGVVAMKNGKRSHQLVSVVDPSSPSAEAVRALRTSLQVAGLRSPLHTLLITSAGPGEGKSFIAANLAVSLAYNGSKVILVDADLRKPSQHTIFDVRRTPGFTDLVINQSAEPDQVLLPTGVDNLSLLTAGSTLPSPAELLGSPRAAEVMERLKQYADIIIYDSPPAATVTDAVVMAARMDGVLQVVGSGQTRINHVLRCKAVLDRVGAHVIGPVLNRVTLSDLGYHSYYYYGYYGHEDDDSDGNKSGGEGTVGRRRFWTWLRRSGGTIAAKARVDAK